MAANNPCRIETLYSLSSTLLTFPLNTAATKAAAAAAAATTIPPTDKVTGMPSMRHVMTDAQWWDS